MRIALFSSLFLALALLSCQQGEKKLTTENGYEYIKYTNEGGPKPLPGEYVYFHAQMRNGDSVVYASREQGASPFLQIPAVDNPARKPSPLEDVLKMMSVGDSVTVLINIDTLPTKPRGFENASILYYDVALLEIKSAEQYQEEAKAEREEGLKAAEATKARQAEVAAQVGESLSKYKAGSLGDALKSTPTGLKYVMQEEGAGKPAQPGRQVSVHYYGVLMDGTMFDNSFERGDPIQFPVGQGRVIPGWDEGIGMLKEGSKATLFIPAQLAYGEQGSPPVIPPNSELVFYVELVEVN